MAVAAWQIHQSLQALLFWLHYNLMLVGANVPRALLLCQVLYVHFPKNPYNKPRVRYIYYSSFQTKKLSDLPKVTVNMCKPLAHCLVRISVRCSNYLLLLLLLILLVNLYPRNNRQMKCIWNTVNVAGLI